MSKWGTSMKQRANRHYAEAKSAETNQRHPLRKITGYQQHPQYASLTVEVLECGHYQLPRSDMFGETNAIKRRCRKCKNA